MMSLQQSCFEFNSFNLKHRGCSSDFKIIFKDNPFFIDFNMSIFMTHLNLRFYILLENKLIIKKNLNQQKF